MRGILKPKLTWAGHVTPELLLLLGVTFLEAVRGEGGGHSGDMIRWLDCSSRNRNGSSGLSNTFRRPRLAMSSCEIGHMSNGTRQAGNIARNMYARLYSVSLSRLSRFLPQGRHTTKASSF